MVECMMAVEAPEEQEWDTLDLDTEATTGPEDAVRVQRPAAHRHRAAGSQLTSGLAQSKSRQSSQRQHGRQQVWADEQTLVEASTGEGTSAIHATKQKLMDRNETIVKLHGALQRAPRTRSAAPVPTQEQHSPDSGGLLTDEAVKQILHCPTMHATGIAHLECSPSDAFDAASGSGEQSMDPSDVPDGVHLHASAGRPAARNKHEAAPSAPSGMDGMGVGSSGRQRSLAHRASSRLSSRGAPRTREVLVTACAAGTLLKWALDEQLQSDQYKARTRGAMEQRVPAATIADCDGRPSWHDAISKLIDVEPGTTSCHKPACTNDEGKYFRFAHCGNVCNAPSQICSRHFTILQLRRWLIHSR